MANYNAIQVGILVQQFLIGGTCLEIAQRTGYNHATVMRYARTWHRQGVVYIDRYKRDSSYKPIKVWKLNTDRMADADRPTPMTNKERCDRYKAKKNRKNSKNTVARIAYELRKAA